LHSLVDRVRQELRFTRGVGIGHGVPTRLWISACPLTDWEDVGAAAGFTVLRVPGYSPPARRRSPSSHLVTCEFSGPYPEYSGTTGSTSHTGSHAGVVLGEQQHRDADTSPGDRSAP
jgi:hypothetical protein